MKDTNHVGMYFYGDSTLKNERKGLKSRRNSRHHGTWLGYVTATVTHGWNTCSLTLEIVCDLLLPDIVT